MNEAEAGAFYRDVAAILHDIDGNGLTALELRQRLVGALHGAAERQMPDPPILLVIAEGQFARAGEIVGELIPRLEPGTFGGILIIPVEATR